MVTTATNPRAVGDLVSLSVTFGRQTRLKCITCTRYMPTRLSPTCGTCGTVYRPSTITGDFIIESLP
mgnify:FL=1